MGFYTADGAAVNAAPTSPRLRAAAAISGAASVAPSATREKRPVGTTILGAAALTAAMFSTFQPSASATAEGHIYPTPTKTHASGASVTASVVLQTFVTRNIEADALVTGTAQIVAFPADEVGNSDVAASVFIAPDATRTTRPRAHSAANSTVVADATHLRMPATSIAATGGLYAEVGINGVFEANGLIHGVSVVQAAPLNYKFQGSTQAFATGTAAPYGAPTRVQHPRVQSVAIAAVILAEPTITATPFALVNLNSAVVTATGTRVLTSSPALTATGRLTFSRQPVQKHIGTVGIVGRAVISPNDTVTAYAISVVSTSAAVVAEAGRVLLPVTAIHAAAQTTFDPYRVANGEASTIGAADIVSADAIRYVMPLSNLTATAGGSGSATVTTEPVGIGGIALITADLSILKPAQANIEGTVIITSGTFANMESVDPPCRVFYRPAETYEFYKPEQQFEFTRRCA